MKENITIYADVILPIPLPGFFSYVIPPEWVPLATPGKRVVVPLGKKRLLAGIVRRLKTDYDFTTTPKEIIAVLDEKELLQEEHFRFWEWMAEYYLCTPGEIMVAALPASFRLESETSISLHPDFDGNMSALSDKEFLIAEALQYTNTLTISQISDITDQQKVIHLVNGLIEKQVIISTETLTESYKAKKMTMLRLAPPYRDEQAMEMLLNDMSNRAFKQMELLMLFLQLSGGNLVDASFSRQELLRTSGASYAALKALCDKDIFEEFSVEVSRLGHYVASRDPEEIVLNDPQQHALSLIKQGFANLKPVLLHGVTGSGKTEIYIKLMQEAVKRGKQVLYLLPEIALTSQIINRLRVFFGNRVQVYHSKYSDRERSELWNRVVAFSGVETDPFIIVGARSALFLPLKNPGLIIIDEEHDHSFKQNDPAPRYHGRDAAIMLAYRWKVPVLLGTATPAIETYHHAATGKYVLAELPVRFGESVMPKVIVADVAEARRTRTMKSHYTPAMVQHIRETLQNKQQVILFQNRRGFSLRIVCSDCGWTPGCPHCDVTLTYHKFIDKLKCHYCGYLRSVPVKCHECASNDVRTSGFGTEKIEEEMGALFPDAKVKRMDFDTTRTKNAYQSIIEDFEQKKIDILIGTQMVSKGLDFSNVGLVGVMNADAMISFPDFRSWERSFQHIVQVSGRAGRQKKRGTVVIQTHKPSHEVIRLACSYNYKGLYESQIAERFTFHYPPFTRLIRIVCKSKDASLVSRTAFELTEELRKGLGSRVLGPEYPLVSKIKNEYLRQILIKFKVEKGLPEKKKWAYNVILKYQNNPAYRKIRFIPDVDPY